jgi:DNA-binding response OmpR family regulator
MVRAHNGGAQAESTLPIYAPPGVTLRILDDEGTVQINDRIIDLTPTELQLLQHLARHPRVLQPAERLLREVWEYPVGSGDTALVRTHVRNLRRKIELDPARPTILLSIHGRGYTLNIDPNA